MEHWDKRLMDLGLSWGLSWEQVRLVTGEIAEQRQIADREGWERGYECGFQDSEKRKKSNELP